MRLALLAVLVALPSVSASASEPEFSVPNSYRVTGTVAYPQVPCGGDCTAVINGVINGTLHGTARRDGTTWTVKLAGAELRGTEKLPLAVPASAPCLPVAGAGTVALVVSAGPGQVEGRVGAHPVVGLSGTAAGTSVAVGATRVSTEVLTLTASVATPGGIEQVELSDGTTIRGLSWALDSACDGTSAVQGVGVAAD